MIRSAPGFQRVAHAIQRNVRNRDAWPMRETGLQIFQGGIASLATEHVSLAMYDDVDEIRIVEGPGATIKRGLVKGPSRRPSAPKPVAQITAVLA